MAETDIDYTIKELLLANIRSIPDFPEPGIVFRDITPLLNDTHLLQLTSSFLAKPFRGLEIDYVAGLESRGFLFGTNLAQDLNAGFIPIRKPGKLPADTESVTYTLEYGTDSLEIHKDSFKPGDKVLIHDDLMASAATELIEKLGGIVAGYSFILELVNLKGHEKLQRNKQYHSLLQAG